MPVDIPYGEPDTLRAGNTWSWKRALSAYPADTWTLTYTLISSSAKITVTASASGTDHLVEVLAATTANYTAGSYDLISHITDGTDRYTVEYGTIEILPDLEAATTYDNRSHARIMVEAIEATLQSRATRSQLDLIAGTHGRRALSRDRSQLIELRSRYKAEVESEEQSENIRNGLGTGRTVRVRFT